MWLPLVCSLLGTWPTIQSCALTGNQTINALICRPTLSPLSYTSQSSLAIFKILSLSLTFGILSMMCLGVILFGSILFGTLYASWTYMSISSPKLGKFSLIIFSNKFSVSCSSSSSGTSVIQILVHLKMSQRLLSLSLFFKILFSSCCSD